MWFHLELCHRNLDTLERARYFAKLDCVIQSTTGKCAPIQAAKYPVRGRALNTEEQVVPPFRRTMIRVTLQVFQAKKTCLQNVI